MSKKAKRLIIGIFIVFALIMTVPIPTGQCKDGGTKTYTSLTYKIVVWNHLYDDGEEIQTYHKTKIYWFPDNYSTLDLLWDEEKANIE